MILLNELFLLQNVDVFSSALALIGQKTAFALLLIQTLGHTLISDVLAGNLISCRRVNTYCDITNGSASSGTV